VLWKSGNCQCILKHCKKRENLAHNAAQIRQMVLAVFDQLHPSIA